MTTTEVAASLTTRKWYEKKDKSAIDRFQIHGRAINYPQLFNLNGSVVSLIEKTLPEPPRKNSLVNGSPQRPNPSKKDEHYVIDICDKFLTQLASRQHRFYFLMGDRNVKGKAIKLPVDAYYEKLKLVVEFRERQHTESVMFFDKPNKRTVSNVHRGEQRKIYDERRRQLIPQNGLTLIEICYSDFEFDGRKRIVRNESKDIEVVRKLLHAFFDHQLLN